MTSPPSELSEAFVDAYPGYVARTLQQRGIPMDPVLADAVVEGAEVLGGLLASLDALDPVEQRTSPLELFREALRPVDRALSTIGARPPDDPALASTAPWDRYGLAPGSSQVLGERAHAAHLAWGIAKANAFAPLARRPGAVVDAPEPISGTLSAILEERGYRIVEAPEDAMVALVVLGDRGVAERIGVIGRAGVHVVALGDDVDDLTTPGLIAAGASRVVSTERFLASPDACLPRLA